MVWFGTLSMALLCAIGCVSLARMLAHVQFAWTRLGMDEPRFTGPAADRPASVRTQGAIYPLFEHRIFPKTGPHFSVRCF